jgi:hypothetical protein
MNYEKDNEGKIVAKSLTDRADLTCDIAQFLAGDACVTNMDKFSNMQK